MISKNIQVLLAGVFLPFLLYSQIEINGRIIDANQEPIIGAQVITEDRAAGTITDEEGFFVLQIDKKNTIVVIKYLGYNQKKITLSENSTDLGTIVLRRSSTTLDEVIVSASPDNFKRSFKGSNFRINPVALKNINPLNTEEVLRTIPGVNIVGDMGLSNRPNISIRGSWGRRSKKVIMLEDGSPSAPAPYIAPGAYYNPVSDRITSIEVYKGADLLKYGPNNMYGAVNYITALPPQTPELRIKMIGGQRNYSTGLLSYGGTWNSLGALVEGVYKNFDGYTDNSSVEVLNLNAKIYSKLSENQSLYFKVSAQFEDNQASLSSQTPFTFTTDPTQNPLDADQFTMRRYGMDIIHKWLPSANISLTSKIYASDFERDWWRQVTAKVRASEVRDYVGEQIYMDRYNYLDNATFDNEDYVIVGRILNGMESTTDSRWTFTVAGFKETVAFNWEAFGATQNFEANINLHRETFKDRFLEAPDTRWARHGNTVKDLWYHLYSINGYIRQEFQFNKWGITPIARLEHVNMYRQDLIAAASNPNINGTDEGREPNIYTQFLPGITVDYKLPSGELYASIYEGMIAPSKVFGFLVERDGIITNPLDGQDINIAPELSWNKEIGWRGILFKDKLSGQLTYFNNHSRNFYAGGRNEVFEKLGEINVEGVEMAIASTLFKNQHQKLNWHLNLTWLRSKVLTGKLVDRDLFSQVIHNEATRSEYIQKVNDNREAFDIYVHDGMGGETLLAENQITMADFDNIAKSVIQFGKDGIEEARAPYTPAFNLSTGLNYDYKKLSVGVSAHYVGDQYTEFHNFDAESADGAIGKLPAFFTLDAFANYEFIIGKKTNCRFFINGKNITNNIYRASRLNRATSGIFPGGFRQVIVGVDVEI